MAQSKLNTLFAGTVGPTGDRPGPDSVAGRAVLYLVMALLFPVALVFYLVWLTLFTYARLPWWIPGAAGAGLLAAGLLTGFVGGGAVKFYLTGYIQLFADIFNEHIDPLTALSSHLGQILLGQLWLGFILASLAAGTVTMWKYVRRPVHKELFIKPGPVLWRRWKRTAQDISRGVGSPVGGITVGVSQDLRHPWYAGGKAGEAFGNRVVLTDAELAAHVFVVGASGSGKTQAMLSGVRDVIRQGRGLVFIDCKGDPDVSNQIAAWSERYGREFLHWSIYDANQPYDGPAEGPAFYDPICRGDASRRKDLIMGAFLWESPYYKDIVANYLQTLFRVQDLVPPLEGTDNLSDAAHLLSPMALSHRARYIDLAAQPDLSEALTRTSGMGPNEKSGIDGMYSRIQTVVASTAGRFLRVDPDGRRDIDLRKVAYEGQVVVFSLPGNMYEETSSMVAGLIIQDLKTLSGELLEEKAPAPLHVYVDEFSAIDSTNILGLLQRARASKMPCTLATQALADLARRDPTFPKSVIGTVSSFMIHRANDEEDARIYAGLSGITRKTVERISYEQSSSIFGTVGAATATGSGYLEERDEYTVPVEAFQKLKPLEGVLIAKESGRYVNTYYVVPEDAAIGKREGQPAAVGRISGVVPDTSRDEGLPVDHPPMKPRASTADRITYPHPTTVNLTNMASANYTRPDGSPMNILDALLDAPKPSASAAPAPADSGVVAPPAPRQGPARPTRPGSPAQNPGAAQPAGAPLPVFGAPAPTTGPAPEPMRPPAPRVERGQNPEEWNGIP